MVKQDSTGAMVNWHQVIRDPRLWTPQNVQLLQQIYKKHNPAMRCGNPNFQTQFQGPVCTHYTVFFFQKISQVCKNFVIGCYNNAISK